MLRSSAVGATPTTTRLDLLCRHVAAVLILIALRTRRFVLPFLVAGVAAITLVGSEFSAINILVTATGLAEVLLLTLANTSC